MSLKSPLITVMTRAAFKAARHLKRDFGEVENLQVFLNDPATSEIYTLPLHDELPIL